MDKKSEISLEDFLQVDLRIGTVLKCYTNEHARKPSYVLEIDLGNLGVVKSSAQLTKLYSADEIVGKQVVVVANFPPIQIAKTISECLVLGAVGQDGEVVLLQPARRVNNGMSIA